MEVFTVQNCMIQVAFFAQFFNLFVSHKTHKKMKTISSVNDSDLHSIFHSPTELLNTEHCVLINNFIGFFFLIICVKISFNLEFIFFFLDKRHILQKNKKTYF